MPDPKRDTRPLSPEEMDRLTFITEEDKQRAREAWLRDAPPHARGYFDAKPEETE